MADFLSEEECFPNVNNVVVAGQVSEVEPLAGKGSGVSFVVTYQKHWPSGEVEAFPIRCYFTGQQRIAHATWLKVGEWVLVYGQIQENGQVYALQLEHLSRPPRKAGTDDASRSGAQRYGRG
jgi:hypothetical protein